MVLSPNEYQKKYQFDKKRTKIMYYAGMLQELQMLF